MSLKEVRRREKFEKKVRQGFRGYPVATVAYYGPDDRRASKVVVGIVTAQDAEADPMKKWFSADKDVRTEPTIRDEILSFIEDNAVKSIALISRIIGCPHEEGIDYPDGASCPQCPFWENRDRFTGRVIE